MNGFASQVGMLPEQVWNADGLPDRHLYRGRPSGSAMPLAWTHSEYIRLLRSIRDEKVFDLPRHAWQRYVRQRVGSEFDLWRFDYQTPTFPEGRRLRIETDAPAVVHFSTDRWEHVQELPTRDIGLGFHVVDLPTAEMKIGEALVFTFRWPAAQNRWEGRDFQLTVDPPRGSPAEPPAVGRPWRAMEHQNPGAVR
jgi:glucoamylase